MTRMVTMLPKSKPWRSAAYGRFVSSLPCCVTGAAGPNDPHHENLPGDGGRKASDERQVPLAHALHVELETPGNSRPACWAKWGVDVEEAIRQTQAAWVAKCGRREWAGE